MSFPELSIYETPVNFSDFLKKGGLFLTVYSFCRFKYH